MRTIRIVALSVALVTVGAFSGKVTATEQMKFSYKVKDAYGATAQMVATELRQKGVDVPDAELNALARRVAAAAPGTTVCNRDSTVCIRIVR